MTESIIESTELKDFYWYCLVGAIENPHSMFETTKYRHYDETDKKYEAFADIVDVEDDNKKYKITLDSFRKAFDIINGDPAKPIEGLHSSYRERFHTAWRLRDSCDLDAYDFNIILQIAIFNGEVIYG